MFKPFVSANIVIGFLLLVIIVSWLRGPRATQANGLGSPALSGPGRIAAYEEIWRREESGLWDWLEDRIGMQGIVSPSSSSSSDQAALKTVRKQRENSLKGLGRQAALADEVMSDREMDHAIKVTEERLEDLKLAVQKRRRLKEVQRSGEASTVMDEAP